jgi:drug/metabolite transporter (DMT)-like permease
VAADTDNHARQKESRFQAAYQRWIADGLLLLVAIIWGTTFVIVKGIVARIDPFVLIGMRFLVASIAVTLALAPRIRQMDRTFVKAGIVIGLILFAGYALQTVALEFTTASKCGFITGLSVVLVPVFSALMFKKSPDIPSLVGVGFATLGLALLTLNFADARLIQTGDALSLLGAVAFGLHIVVVGKFAPLHDVRILVLMQLWTVALAAFAMVALRVFVFGYTMIWAPVGNDFFGIGFLGVFATALTLMVQNIAQKFTSPTHVAIIFVTEPVFAGIFGWLILGEILTATQIVGGALILVGMFVAEIIS